MMLARALGAVGLVGFLSYPALGQGQTVPAELAQQDLTLPRRRRQAA